jgi:hypothetical protein
MGRPLRKPLHLFDQLLDFGGKWHWENRGLDRRYGSIDRWRKLTARTIAGKRRETGFSSQASAPLVSSPA